MSRICSGNTKPELLVRAFFIQFYLSFGDCALHIAVGYSPLLKLFNKILYTLNKKNSSVFQNFIFLNIPVKEISINQGG